MKTLKRQDKQLTILFKNIVMKARTETELAPMCKSRYPMHFGSSLLSAKVCKTGENVKKVL